MESQTSKEPDINNTSFHVPRTEKPVLDDWECKLNCVSLFIWQRIKGICIISKMTCNRDRKFFAFVLLLPIVAACFAGCSDGVPNRLVGHTYVIAPVNSIFKMKLGMSMATIEHEYKSNHEVLITTYIGIHTTKKESQPYSFDGSTYKLDNENYDITFAGDTALFSVNGDVLFRLEPVK